MSHDGPGYALLDATQRRVARRFLAAEEAQRRHLVETKKRGERFELTAEERDRWLGESERALGLLELAHAESILPEAPPNPAEIEAWLLDLRRASWSTRGS